MPGSFARTRIRARRLGLVARALLLLGQVPLGGAGAAPRPVTAEGLAELLTLRPVLDCADVPSLDLGGGSTVSPGCTCSPGWRTAAAGTDRTPSTS
jgi:hypothetical protein